MNNGQRPDIVPFGKYKGQPIEALIEDPKYVEWLNGQGWVKDKYPQFYTVIINNFQEPSETPEHNALQALFLDDELCLRFSSILLSTKEKEHFLMGLISKHFEAGGIDVFLTYSFWSRGERYNHKTYKWIPCWGSEWERCAIEIKPSIGDDFPAVLRQARNMGTRDYRPDQRVVVFRDFVATSVTLEQVRAMFNHSGVLLISLDEIRQGSVSIYPDESELPNILVKE